MIDHNYLKKINLVTIPTMQRFLGTFVLMPNYRLFAKVDIEIQNMERIPKDETVIFAMNHTDRYNYWPFQYKLWRANQYPYTTVWVKAKYYKNAALGKMLDWCNLIPVPSMGYLIEEVYKKNFKRKIEPGEYRAVKDLIDDKGEPKAVHLSKELYAARDQFVRFVRSHYDAVMNRVGDLSKAALLEKTLNLIIFPEGTRSLQVSEGRTGLAQLALHTEKKIVPVGCNNCDAVYSGALPFAKSGKVIYRIGEPVSVHDELKPFRILEKFQLFSKESQLKYKEQFEGVTRIVMERINRMVDEKYRRSAEKTE